MTIYLNLYDVGQAYGGSEEGGWWYSVGEYLETVGTFATRDAAKAARATLEETRTAYRMGHGPHDGTSPDGEPDDSYLMAGGRWGDGSVKAFVEDHPGHSFPTERPQYE